MSQEKLPKDREQLVVDNLNLIHYALQRKMHIYPSNQSYEDYYQEGCIGLILAAIRFDESKGFKFSTFAFPNIIGLIQQYKQRAETGIKLPRNIQNCIFKAIQYTNKGYTPSEIEEITGISAADIQYAINIMSPASLSCPLSNDEDGNTTIEDVIPDSDPYEVLLDEQHVLSTIQKVSDKITDPIQKGIWEEYIFSTLYGEKLPQKYFQNKYNISQGTISKWLDKFKSMFVTLLQR